MTLANADEYERAIAQAESNPAGLTERQKKLLARLQNEAGERGNRARAAMQR